MRAKVVAGLCAGIVWLGVMFLEFWTLDSLVTLSGGKPLPVPLVPGFILALASVLTAGLLSLYKTLEWLTK